jgi:hypothetical protein
MVCFDFSPYLIHRQYGSYMSQIDMQFLQKQVAVAYRSHSPG